MMFTQKRVLALLLYITLILGMFNSNIFIQDVNAASMYYVSTTGTDSASTPGTSSQPWKTVAYAASRVPADAGHTIHIRAGTYNETSIIQLPTGVNMEGEATGTTILRCYFPTANLVELYSNPIGANGNQTLSNFTIDGINRSLYCGIFVRGRHNVVVHDVNFINIKDHGLRITSESVTWADPSVYMTGIQVYNCRFTNCSTDGAHDEYTDLYGGTCSSGCLEIGGLRGALIHDNVINEDTGYGLKLAGGGNLRAIKVYNNTITVNQYDPQWACDIALELWFLYDDSEIYNNTMTGWVSIVYGNKGSGSASVKLHDNRIILNRPGLQTQALEFNIADGDCYNNDISGGTTGIVAYGDASNCKIHHNVITYPPSMGGTGGFGIGYERANVTNCSVYNNVVEGPYDSGVKILVPSDGTKSCNGFYVRNNVFINVRYGVSLEGPSNKISNIVFSYNAVNAGTALVNNPSGATLTTQNNRTVTQPSQLGLNLSGSKPDPYYRPSGAQSLVVDAGTDVGVPYLGAAPDIGLYEYSSGSSSQTIPQSGMTATATSQHPDNEASKAIDGNTSTLWHTEWTPMVNLPQSVTLNLGGTFNVCKVRYLPRQDSYNNGNITGYKVYASTNGVNFTQVASGTWGEDKTEKSVSFTAIRASYIRLEATSGYGGFASAAELNVEKTPGVPHSGMTATATSQHTDNEASKAIDDNPSTLWHSEWIPMANLPQSVTLNLGGTFNVGKVRYLPRQDSERNGDITGYKIYVSTNGVQFTQVASGTWADDKTEKSAVFTATNASYIRLEATSGYGGFASAAEINVE